MEYAVFQAPKMDVFRINFSSLREFTEWDSHSRRYILAVARNYHERRSWARWLAAAPTLQPAIDRHRVRAKLRQWLRWHAACLRLRKAAAGFVSHAPLHALNQWRAHVAERAVWVERVSAAAQVWRGGQRAALCTWKRKHRAAAPARAAASPG